MSSSPAAPKKPLRVGLVGAGIGGLAASIALKHHGGDDTAITVTVLEAAAELGEIGAGIQMTPNVARLLIRWGVADVIGDDLVEFEEVNLRRKDGTLVGHTPMRSREWCGVPWWLVHRMHLHNGLAEVAKRKGVKLIINAKVNSIDYTSGHDVSVTTEAGDSWTFDVLIGSDGLKSVVRSAILPDVRPRPPTGNAAYRAIVPAEKIRADPLTRELLDKKSMDVWMGASRGSQHGYVISYPISGGKDFNMVMSHHRDYLVEGVEEASKAEVNETFKSYDPRIRRAIELIDHDIKRWPLMVTRCPTWSNPQKNVVLMGDAAHSMVNHLAQGAATSMEDGAFVGVVLAAVARGAIGLHAAVGVYEAERMPLADVKQQASFINGQLWHLQDDSPEMRARDRAMEGELRGELLMKTPNMFADPYIWRTLYDYDPEEHAHRAIEKYRRGEEPRDSTSHVTTKQSEIYVDWFMPGAAEKKVAAKL